MEFSEVFEVRYFINSLTIHLTRKTKRILPHLHRFEPIFTSSTRTVSVHRSNKFLGAG